MITNGRIIRKAQIYLRRQGSKITVDGLYTIGMRSALKSFQRKHGLERTGELDIPTWKALKKENSLRRRILRKCRR